MHFRFYPLRFRFTARDAVHFPAGKSSNLLRGAFGAIFRRIACVPECRGVRECPVAGRCAYERMFEPSALEGGPSGLVDLPRPFVFRATQLDGRTLECGEDFSFDLHVFDLQEPAIPYFVISFLRLANDGIGPGRGRAELRDVALLDEAGDARGRVFEAGQLIQQEIRTLDLPLAWDGVGVERVVVRFVTPTELKTGQKLAPQPEFFILAGRIRDRVSKLRELYGDGPLDIDFRGYGERAEAVRMTRCAIRQVNVERRSSRTGQVHPIGGFVGEAEYQGHLGEFMPYLLAAKWVGVGRQTVWGKGEIEVRLPTGKHR